MSPVDIILSIGQPFLDSLRECSNSVVNVDVTMKKLYLYHALLTLRTLIKSDSIGDFFLDHPFFSWSNEVKDLQELFARTDYFNLLRKVFRGYKGIYVYVFVYVKSAVTFIK